MISEPISRTLLDYAQICHRGLVRQENQDAMGVAETPAGTLFVISDGVGGYAGGAEASQMISAEAEADAHKLPQEGDAMSALIELVQRLNGNVYARAQGSAPELARMSATVVIALIRGAGSSDADILNVGDSRAYLYRAQRLQQLSTDHTAAQLLVDAGTISMEESRTHPQSSVLTRSMGQRAEVTPSTTRVLLEPEDLLLLCSDGLHGYVEDKAIEDVLSNNVLTVRKKTDALLQLALDAGGGDNITIQLIQVISIAKTQLSEVNASLPSRAVQTPARTGRFSGFRGLAAAILAAGLFAVGCVAGYEWWQSQVPASTAPLRSIPASAPPATPVPVAPPNPSRIKEKSKEHYKESLRGAREAQLPAASAPANSPEKSPGVRSTLPATLHNGLDRMVTRGHRAGSKVRESLPDGGDPRPRNEPPQQ